MLWIKWEDVDGGRAEDGQVPVVGVEPLEFEICVKPDIGTHLLPHCDMLEQYPGHLPRIGAGKPPCPYSRQTGSCIFYEWSFAFISRGGWVFPDAKARFRIRFVYFITNGVK